MLGVHITTGGGAMDTAGILALETRRYAAMTSNSLDALADLFHDDMIYTHSSGVVDTKAVRDMFESEFRKRMPTIRHKQD